jgi:transposase-like protein
LEHEQRAGRSRRKFSAEFKWDAVEIVNSSDKPIAEVARELGIYDSTLGNWVLCRRRHSTHFADLRVMPTRVSVSLAGAGSRLLRVGIILGV